MFKKVSVAQTRPLSGKDIKQLKKDIATNFPDLKEHEVTELIPSKAEVNLIKLSNRTQAYTCNGSTPLFFDPEGRGNLLVPTVYVLWQYPHILPHLLTYSEVSPKVLGGADLFLQGVIVPEEGLGSFSAGDLRVIKIPDNPYPFAVGLLEVSSEDVARKGLTGRGLKLLHHYPDLLYGLGPKTIPSDDFTPARIFPQARQPQSAPEPAAPSHPSSEPSQPEAKPQPQGTRGEAAPIEGHEASSSDDEDEEAEDDDGSGVKQAGADSAPHSEHAQKQQSSTPPGQACQASDPDGIVARALVAGLASVQDSDLPLLCSNFWSRNVLQGRPAGADLDLKKTSYKKLPKLLSTFEKKGLLQVKLIHKQDHLGSINRMHPLLVQHATTAPAAPAEITVRQEGGADAASKISIMVTYEYRVPPSLRPIFSMSGPPDALHTTEVVRECLHTYAASQNLRGPDRASITLDRLMATSLYNKREPEAEGDLVDAERLLQRLLAKLLRFCCITRQTPEGEKRTVHKGELKPIVVSMEDRQGGRKHITRVAHYEPFGLDPEELASVLQRKFQTNASVTKLPGKTETAKEIALQGNLLHDIPRLLQSEFGIEASFVKVQGKGK